MRSGAAGAGEGRIEQTDKRCEYELGPEYDSGGAGIVTTVAEYARLIDALANGGLGQSGSRILSEAAVRLLHTNQLSDVQLTDFRDWPQLAGYGYGLGVRTMGLILLVRAVGILNFAQGDLMMFGAYIAACLLLDVKLPLWLMLPVAALWFAVIGIIFMPFDRITLVEPLAVAVGSVKRAHYRGANVAVIGAGTIGNLIAQAAGALGAGDVLITDVVDAKLEYARA